MVARNTTLKQLLAAALVLTALGCRQYHVGTLDEPAETPATTGAAADADAPVARPEAPAPAARREADAATAAAEPAPVKAAAAAAPAAEKTTLEKAQVGAGTKGKKYGGGIITEPARVYFRVEERLTFLQVDQAMNLYRGEHEHVPQSPEEFWEKIIKANQITLPTLPQGQEYLYDAKKGELMIKRPG